MPDVPVGMALRYPLIVNTDRTVVRDPPSNWSMLIPASSLCWIVSPLTIALMALNDSMLRLLNSALTAAPELSSAQ